MGYYVNLLHPGEPPFTGPAWHNLVVAVSLPQRSSCRIPFTNGTRASALAKQALDRGGSLMYAWFVVHAGELTLTGPASDLFVAGGTCASSTAKQVSHIVGFFSRVGFTCHPGEIAVTDPASDHFRSAGGCMPLSA